MTSIVVPVAGAQPVQQAKSDLVLQPGTVVNARVLQILEQGLARIAIGGAVLELPSDVPLTPGETLRLAVSGDANALRLSVVGGAGGDQPPRAAAPAQPLVVNETAGQASARVANQMASISEAGDAAPLAARPTPAAAPPAVALREAVQAAVTRQTGSAPLFADAAAAQNLTALPRDIRIAAAQLTALRAPLNENLSAPAMREALGRSGILLERKLAEASPQAAPSTDIKAAMLVLRDTLSRFLASQPATTAPSQPAATPAPNGTTPSQPAAPGAGMTGDAVAHGAPHAAQGNARPAVVSNSIAVSNGAVATPATSPEASSKIPLAASVPTTIRETAILPDAARPASVPTPRGEAAHVDKPTQPPSPAVASGASVAAEPATTPMPRIEPGATAARPMPLPILRMVAAQTGQTIEQVQAALEKIATGSPAAPTAASNAMPDAAMDAAPARLSSNLAGGSAPAPFVDRSPESHTAPPPWPGDRFSGQPVAASAIAGDEAPADIARRLLDDVDGALARQTLLQAASLPDAAQAGKSSTPEGPRWNFEIPFATPQGTAMGQFEISRDGTGKGGDGRGERIWRARFTIDIEPAGPVHAQIALAGERASVRLWADRATTTAQLRAHAADLTQALREAALEPGSIAIGEAPAARASAVPGRFLDRAT